MTNRTAEAMIDKWDGLLATMETGECDTCDREFPVDAMTHHEESATSECHQCGQATTGGGELMRKTLLIRVAITIALLAGAVGCMASQVSAMV